MKMRLLLVLTFFAFTENCFCMLTSCYSSCHKFFSQPICHRFFSQPINIQQRGCIIDKIDSQLKELKKTISINKDDNEPVFSATRSPFFGDLFISGSQMAAAKRTVIFNSIEDTIAGADPIIATRVGCFLSRYSSTYGGTFDESTFDVSYKELLNDLAAIK